MFVKAVALSQSLRQHVFGLVLQKTLFSSIVPLHIWCSGLCCCPPHLLSYFVLSAECLSVEEFPEHIKKLVQKEKEFEEQEKRQREIERNTCKVFCLLTWFHHYASEWEFIKLCLSFSLYLQIKLFCVHPVKMMMESKLEVHKDKTLNEATEMAYKVFISFYCLQQ